MQNRPGSDLDGLERVWPNASGLEASWCAGIIGLGFWQEPKGRNQFPTFRLGFAHPQTTRIIWWRKKERKKNQPGSGLVLADCVRFWPNGSGPEASRCARIIRPASGQLIRTGCEWDPACLVGVDLISLCVCYPYVAPRFSFQRNKETLDRLCSCSFDISDLATRRPFVTDAWFVRHFVRSRSDSITQRLITLNTTKPYSKTRRVYSLHFGLFPMLFLGLNIF